MVGIVVVFTRPRVAAGHLLVAWLGAAIVGLAAGGSYWHHYLLQLVPVAAVLGAIALTGKTWGRVVVVAGLATAVVTTGVRAVDAPRTSAASVVGREVGARAAPGDTALVLYTAPGVYRSSGVPSAYPYYWGTMVDDVPRAKTALLHLLSSPTRPTFVVLWSDWRAHARTIVPDIRRLLAEYYKDVATVCQHRIYERKDVRRHVPRRPACR